MGASSTPAELAGKLAAAARGIENGTREGVREAAIVGKAIFEQSLPTRKMGNVGRSGARLGARFEAPTSNTNPTAVVKYTGPVHLLNTGARPHLIGPKGWRRSRGGSSRALKFTGGDGGIRRGVVMHPGTKGSRREFFPAAVKRVVAAAPKQIQMAERRALTRVFG